MRPLWICLTIGALLTSRSPCLSQDTEPRRVLFLGNSVFYSRGGLAPPFAGFCKEAALSYQPYSQWHTPPHSLGVRFLNYGRIPISLPAVAADDAIHTLIRSEAFEFVILEARRPGFLLPDTADLPDDAGESIAYEKNLNALRDLHRTIVESGARMVLYMHPGKYSHAAVQRPVAQIYRRLHADLMKPNAQGVRHSVILVPAMLLWIDAVRKYGHERWYVDDGHGNALARYASACLLYTYLTGNDPRQNRFRTLTEVTPAWNLIDGGASRIADLEDATWIKNQVWHHYSTGPR